MENIKSGWPEKEFVFTGDWWETTLGSINTARRNRVTVWIPEFESNDGEKVYPAWLQSTTPPNKVNVADGQSSARLSQD